MTDVEPLDESRLSDRIYLRLRTQVMNGELEPGRRLVESRIASEFGVSQSPIRDALKRLATEGLIVQPPRRGSFVASVDEAEARRMYETRELLEPYAATQFLAFGDERDLDMLRSVVDQMRLAASANDLPGFVELDADFHRTLYHASDHPLLSRIWTSFEHLMRIFTPRTNRLQYQSLAEVTAAHEVLVKVLEAGVTEDVEREFRLHVTDVWRRIDAGANADAGESAAAP